MSSKIRKKANNPETGQTNPFYFAAGMILEVYLALLLCVYPFLIKAGYAETSRIKYGFLTGISYGFFLGPMPVPTFVPLVLLCVLAGCIKQLRRKKTSPVISLRQVTWSRTDFFVLLYVLSLLLSSLVSSTKGELLWGYPAWNMGLFSQALFVVLYFVVSRFFDPDDLRFFVFAVLAVSGAVFLTGILQRLGFDVFHLYGELDPYYHLQFLSTIGQASWFSSYMILFVVMGAFLVWYTDKSTWLYKASLVYLVIGSVCLVTQNTDSAYAGLFFALSLLFIWSFDSAAYMMRFCETSLLILLSFRIAGVARRFAGERAILPDALSVFMMEHPAVWVLIVLFAVLYLALRRGKGMRAALNAGRFSLCGKVYAGALVCVTVCLVFYIVLNSRGILPEQLSSTNNYLLFQRDWGNMRGAAWHDTVLSFFAMFRAEPLKGLFGAGADQFYHVIEAYVSDWTGYTTMVLTNAHNEWLTAFVNFGLFGGAVYAGIFVSSVVACVRKRKEVPYGMAIAACVLAYMVHNVFCYQQYVCTPYIFVIIGLGECLLRENSKTQHAV